MLRLPAIVLLISAVAAHAAAADATPEDVEFSPPRRTAIYFEMGAGAPLGLAGLEAVHRIGSQFEIGAGVGRGFNAIGSQINPTFGHDVQWAVMPRLRVGGRKHVLTLGAGLSGGNYGGGGEWFCDGPCPKRDYPTSYVIWANVEVGTEHWWDSGFALRLFVGYAHGCSSDSCTSASGGSLSIPYFGLGVGYAF